MEAEQLEEAKEAARVLGLAERSAFAWPAERRSRMLRELARQAEASAAQLEAGAGKPA